MCFEVLCIEPRFCLQPRLTRAQDPAGNLQLADGTFHVFPCCKWEHFSSTDLIHWDVVGPTVLGGGTGSMAVREDGAVVGWAP